MDCQPIRTSMIICMPDDYEKKCQSLFLIMNIFISCNFIFLLEYPGFFFNNMNFINNYLYYF